MDFKKLQEVCHKMAIEKGFWVPTGKLEEVRYRNESELLMLVVSELGEACEALRKDNRQPGHVDGVGKEWFKDTFEDEIADAVIRLLDMSEALGIDLEWQIEQKLKYNKTRPNKHGKKF